MNKTKKTKENGRINVISNAFLFYKLKSPISRITQNSRNLIKHLRVEFFGINSMELNN